MTSTSGPGEGKSERTARPPTMRDVAILAGVDRAVVSKVLNKDAKLSVRVETRQRVLDAVRLLDYRPNSTARNLKTARAGAFGLVIPDFRNTVYASIIEGVQQATLSSGRSLLTASLQHNNGDASETADLADVLANGSVDGLLLAGGVEAARLVNRLERIGKPVLSINGRSRDTNRYVVLDDAEGARIGTRYLIDLGHRTVGHLAGPVDSDTAFRRASGFSSAMSDAGLPVLSELVVHSDYTAAGGFTAMQRLLAQRVRPSAVLVANIASALGALQAARLAGVSIPHDLSILSIHDDRLAEYSNPALTVVQMPLFELGVRAIQLLQERAADETVQETVPGRPQLVIRESTAALDGPLSYPEEYHS